jgi:hypothetical protein
MNHYSGLRRSGTRAQKTNVSSKKHPRKQLSDTDSEFSSDDEIAKRRAKVDNDVGFFQSRGSANHTSTRYALATYVDEIELASIAEPQTYAEVMRAPDAEKWQVAMGAEQDSLEKNDTYEITPLSDGVRPITSRWVFKRKLGPDGRVTKYKARLVARGFQQAEGIDYSEIFAAVVKPVSYRILFALAACLGWKVRQMDVVTAFLNGSLDKSVYMKPPPGMRIAKGMVLKLLRALYGLNQSPRAWYEKFRKTMEAWGWRVSAYDPCVFIHPSVQMSLCLWVDDMLIFYKNDGEVAIFVKQISETFSMTDEGKCSYYLGMHVEQAPGSIYIHQNRYAEQILGRYGLTDTTPAKTPTDSSVKLIKASTETANPVFKTEYQSKIGSLNFLSNGTRPDISFSTGLAARYASNPDQSHMDAATRIFAYIRNNPSKGLLYTKEAGLDLRGYVDSDWAGCLDSRKSTTGYVFILAGAPISWSSKRQQIIATSTMDAEYIAATEAAKDAVWIRNFINDLAIPEYSVGSIPLYIDNNSALKLTRNPEFHSRSKHIDAKYHFIREKVMDTKEISTLRVGTKDNLADILTKGLARPTHQNLTERLGLRGGD